MDIHNLNSDTFNLGNASYNNSQNSNPFSQGGNPFGGNNSNNYSGGGNSGNKEFEDLFKLGQTTLKNKVEVKKRDTNDYAYNPVDLS